MSDREMLRTMFGQDAERYDRARPGYPGELFADLAARAGLGPGSRVLEIGCGTGQATRELVRLGCAVVAVELSAELAAVAARNVPEAVVEVAAFEDWVPPAEPFDLVVAATSFHWLDPAVRVVKAAGVLRPGGWLAVVHSEHVAGGSSRFFADAQRCYERFDPATPPGLRLIGAAELPDDTGEFDRSGRFGPVAVLRYEWDQPYTTESYLDVLMTYSGHRALPRPARDALLACLAGLIDGGHGGRITKRYLTRLMLTRLR